MRITRLYIPEQIFQADQTCVLSAEQAHHTVRVLRLQSGDVVEVFNATSGAWQGTLQVSGKNAVLTVEKQVSPPKNVPDLWIVMALVKKEAWDFSVEKATELGVAAIVPVITDFTQSQRLNTERLQTHVIQAAQQCERTDIPALQEPVTLAALLATWDTSRTLYVALERAAAKPLSAVLHTKTAHPAAVLIGPEGGFSQTERQLLQQYPFVIPISLGPRILRSDTAVAAAVTIWQSLCGDMQD